LDHTVPEKFELAQNFPNPFNPATSIRFSLPQANHVSLKVYNIAGQEVATLVNEYKKAGTYEVSFDAKNLPSGTYFYKIVSGELSSVKKMLLIK
ncbi:MAG: T9SS C-terminal target domain-containing protein, partial [Methanobacteriota archaeon]